MTGQDKKIADLELQIEFYKKEIDKCNKVNIELTEQLRIGSVSQQRELLLAFFDLADVTQQSEQFFALLRYTMPDQFTDVALNNIVKGFIEQSK